MSQTDEDMNYQSAEDTGDDPDYAEGMATDNSDGEGADDGAYVESDATDDNSEDEADATALFLDLVSHSRNAYGSVVRSLPKLSTYEPPVLTGELAAELDQRTSAFAPNTPDPRLARMSQHKRGHQRVVNACHLQLLREGGHSLRSPHSNDPAGLHFSAFHRIPSRPVKVVDSMASRGYIGQFTKDGEIFVAAFQNQRRIRMYDVSRGWTLCKDINARNLRWTVTDIALSSDQKFLLYASITPTVHLVNVDRGGINKDVESIANVTDIHECLEFGDANHSNGIWSIQWSADNKEIIAGTADRSLYIYDMAQGKTVVRLRTHDDDVNAVAYGDESSNMIITGSDDTMIKLWDRRLLDNSNQGKKVVGVFVGHSEGITHLDAKGDGRYFISNSKDQTIKLWDMRAMETNAREASRKAREGALRFQWDYRWMEYPACERVVTHQHDLSLASYRGHKVLNTLIRSYWSPLHTTGQRYIYTGSADGNARIYDVVTGKMVSKLAYHREVIRDISWHPFQPMIATTSFDGSICRWEPEVPGDEDAAADEEREKMGVAGGRRRRSNVQSAVESDKAGGTRRVTRSSRHLPAPAHDQLGDQF